MKNKLMSLFIKNILVILSIFFFTGEGFSQKSEEKETSHSLQKNKIILGYYPSWECGLPPEKIKYEYFTHICHSFITSDKTGKIKTEGNMPSKTLTSLAAKNGVKVLISIGGMDSGSYLKEICKNKEIMKKFVSDISSIAIDNGYSGIDLDWEFPDTPDDGRAFIELAVMFKEEFRKKGTPCILTTAVSGIDWAAKNIDGKEAGQIFDFILVMTYDQHGPWSGHAGFNAALHTDKNDKSECKLKSGEEQMKYWENVKKVNKEKLIFGIPFYGRGFAVSEWYAPIQYKDKVKYPYIPFREINSLIKDGWERVWDKETKTPWLKKAGTAEIITYDDEESVKSKAEFVNAEGYGGVFFWEISQDYSNSDNALAHTVRNTVYKK